MRVRTVTGMAVAVLVALLWLAITAQPAAAMACARPVPDVPLALPGGDAIGYALQEPGG